MKHRWSSGRILACHAGDPGSIPGRCTVFLFRSSTTSSTLISHYFNFDFCTYIIIIVQPVHCRTSFKPIQVQNFNNHNKIKRFFYYYWCLLHLRWISRIKSAERPPSFTRFYLHVSVCEGGGMGYGRGGGGCGRPTTLLYNVTSVENLTMKATVNSVNEFSIHCASQLELHRSTIMYIELD